MQLIDFIMYFTDFRKKTFQSDGATRVWVTLGVTAYLGMPVTPHGLRGLQRAFGVFSNPSLVI
jgi:hypothetical protein